MMQREDSDHVIRDSAVVNTHERTEQAFFFLASVFRS